MCAQAGQDTNKREGPRHGGEGERREKRESATTGVHTSKQDVLDGARKRDDGRRKHARVGGLHKAGARCQPSRRPREKTGRTPYVQ
jgi:hypothetical protein